MEDFLADFEWREYTCEECDKKFELCFVLYGKYLLPKEDPDHVPILCPTCKRRKFEDNK